MNIREIDQVNVVNEKKGDFKPRELTLEHTTHGTLAIFKDCLHLKEGIISTQFWNTEKPMGIPAPSGFRNCFTLHVNDQTIYVKPKRSNAKPTLIQDLQAAVHSFHQVSENIKNSQSHKLLIQDIRIRNAAVSVLHEILLLEDIKSKYLSRYGESLPIEEAIGAYISTDQKRFTLYKEVPHARTNSQILGFNDVLLHKYQSWVNIISARISDLGYVIRDLQAMCIESNDLNQTQFVLIDTESWYKSTAEK